MCGLRRTWNLRSDLHALIRLMHQQIWLTARAFSENQICLKNWMRGQAATFLKRAGGFSMYWKWVFARPGDVMTNLQKESAKIKALAIKRQKGLWLEMSYIKAPFILFCLWFFPVLVCTGAIHELFAYVFFFGGRLYVYLPGHYYHCTYFTSVCSNVSR